MRHRLAFGRFELELRLALETFGKSRIIDSLSRTAVGVDELCVFPDAFADGEPAPVSLVDFSFDFDRLRQQWQGKHGMVNDGGVAERQADGNTHQGVFGLSLI